jgi:pilus assembly protein CpaE
MRKIPIAVIDKDNNIQEVIESLKNILGIGNIKFSTSLKDFELLLSQKEPVIALVGPAYELKDIEKLLIIKESALNFIKVILLVKEVNADLLKKALKLNIHDVLEFPFTNNDVKDSIYRVEHSFEGGIEFKETLHRKCRKIMFLNAKGGSGSTFIAVNTAVALKNLTKKDVVLFDLKYQLGDVALMLNLYPKNTVFDLISSIDSLDPDTIDIFLTAHSSGVRVLPSPIDPTQGESINSEVSIKVLNSLVKVCDYVIIDAPFGFLDLVISFIENMDNIFVVATKDVPSIKNLKVYLQILEKLKYPEEKISVILNRADSRVEFELTDIEKTIKRKIDIKIPSDRIAPVSINKGNPMVSIAPKSPISQNIYKIAELLFKLEKIIN